MIQRHEKEPVDVVNVVTVSGEVLIVPEGNCHLLLNQPLLLVYVVDQIVLYYNPPISGCSGRREEIWRLTTVLLE
jgi:hypothetical protein